MQLQSSIDHDSDVNSVVPQSGEAEDEYTISAYGDISLSEVIVPPLPASTRSGSIPLRPKVSQPRLRLKVQRPPMPRRRLSYYVPDPLPHTGGLESGEDWPGSPRPIANVSASVAWLFLSLTTTMNDLSDIALGPTSITYIIPSSRRSRELLDAGKQAS